MARFQWLCAIAMACMLMSVAVSAQGEDDFIENYDEDSLAFDERQDEERNTDPTSEDPSPSWSSSAQTEEISTQTAPTTGSPSIETPSTEMSPDGVSTTEAPSDGSTSEPPAGSTPASDQPSGSSSATEPTGDSSVSVPSGNTSIDPETTTDEPVTTPEPASTAAPDLCANVECFNNGTCDSTTGNCTCEGDSWDSASQCRCHVEAFLCDAAGCGANADCIPGCLDAVCACKQGWESDGEKGCKDFDECSVAGGESLCPGEGALCENVDISSSPDNTTHICRCPEGNWVEGQGPILTCTEVDECAESTDEAPACGAQEGEAETGCQNTLGSFTCDCLPGFIPAGSAAFNESKCVVRPIELQERCFGVDNYTCQYSNYYPSVCEVTGFNQDGTGLALACNCPPYTTKNDATGKCEPSSPINTCTSQQAAQCDEQNSPCVRPGGLNQFQCSCGKGFQLANDGTCRRIVDNDPATTACSFADSVLCERMNADCALKADGDKVCTCKPEYLPASNGGPPFQACVPKTCDQVPCPDDQFCWDASVADAVPASCRCRSPGLTVEDGVCKAVNYCEENEQEGRRACGAMGMFCKSTPQNPTEKYTCECYPPLRRTGNDCRNPFANIDQDDLEVYQVEFTISLSSEEAMALGDRESATFFWLQEMMNTVVNSALPASTDPDVPAAVVSIKDVRTDAMEPSTMKPTTDGGATDAGTADAGTTAGPAATSEAAATDEGSSAALDPSSAAPTDEPTSEPAVTDEASEPPAYFRSLSQHSAAHDSALELIVRAMMQRADQSADVSFAVMTQPRVSDGSVGLQNALLAASTVIDGNTVFVVDDGSGGKNYVIWQKDSLKTQAETLDNVCDVYGVQCPAGGYSCNRTTSATPGTVSFYQCLCASEGLYGFGLETNGVVEVCRDIDECAADDKVNPCSPDDKEAAICINTYGSYECVCNNAEGYTDVGDDKVECVKKCDPLTPFAQACKNGHCMLNTNNDAVCHCNDGFGGFMCDTRISTDDETNTAGIVGGVLGAILALVVIVCGVTIYKLRKKAKKNKGHV